MGEACSKSELDMFGWKQNVKKGLVFEDEDLVDPSDPHPELTWLNFCATFTIDMSALGARFPLCSVVCTQEAFNPFFKVSSCYLLNLAFISVKSFT